MTTFLRISGRDPVVARDGRPFGAGQGNRMRSSGWLHPSVVAGSLRTALGKEAERRFDRATQDELLQIDVAGVLPLVKKPGADEFQLYLPAPNDCVLNDQGKVLRVKPATIETGEGADWPTEGLRPALLPEGDFKPLPVPPFWPLESYADWLRGVDVVPKGDPFLGAALPDLRDHVCLNPESGAAEEGLLFTTAGIGALALPRQDQHIDEPMRPTGPRRFDRFRAIEFSARVGDIPAWAERPLATLSTWHPLGGERRLAHWRVHDDENLWRCPAPVVAALGATRHVALTLATPAVFAGGWKPCWLGADLKGSPWKGAPVLTLVSVCIQRWRAVSGWSYKEGGPKAIRRLVPAGGVYFFESDHDDNRALSGGWLRSVSDGPQEQRDGFGLALWGTW